jgi:thiosulfate/3-mercaptopyruvate sulfurtransferase
MSLRETAQMSLRDTAERSSRDLTTRDKGHASGDILVKPQWLMDHLRDPGLRVVEVDVGPVAFTAGHIEGAVLWNVYRDLKDADYEPADTATIEALVARSGITVDTTVVFYGYAPAMGFWLMKLYGHPDVRILDCPRETWEQAGFPWSAQTATPPTSGYSLPDQDTRIRAGQADVQEAIGDPMCAIVDVRTDSEFRGERFWPSGGLEPGGRAGHVPSAISVSIDDLRDEHGAFRSADDLRELLSSIDHSGSGGLITYCTVGGRACTAWFALTYLLGRRNVRVYDGSWAQWGRMPGTQVESG